MHQFGMILGFGLTLAVALTAGAITLAAGSMFVVEMKKLFDDLTRWIYNREKSRLSDFRRAA